MFVLEFLTKLIKILRSEISPNQISWGFVFGMILGLTPIMSLHNLIVVILIIILKVNLATAIFSFGILFFTMLNTSIAQENGTLRGTA